MRVRSRASRAAAATASRSRPNRHGGRAARARPRRRPRGARALRRDSGVCVDRRVHAPRRRGGARLAVHARAARALSRRDERARTDGGTARGCDGGGDALARHAARCGPLRDRPVRDLAEPRDLEGADEPQRPRARAGADAAHARRRAARDRRGHDGRLRGAPGPPRARRVSRRFRSVTPRTSPRRLQRRARAPCAVVASRSSAASA